MLLAGRTKRLTPPGTSKIRELANELKRSGIDVINFAAGELDVDASDVVKNGAKAAIEDGRNKYTPTLGMKQLRERIGQHVSEQCQITYAWDEIAVTAGAKQALFNAAMVLFDPGDEVIIPRPYWVTFPAQVELAGAKAVFVETGDTGYHLRAQTIEKAITEKTKAVIINSPNNPTGAVYKPDEILKIAQIASTRNFWIIFDECYSELVRNGHSHSNVVQLVKTVKDRTILVNSFSKSHAITGWRIGYAAGPKNVITAMENFQGHTTSNPSSISQYAADAALRSGDVLFMKRVNEILEERVAVAMPIVNTMSEISCAPAEGAFYLFLDVSRKIGKTYKGVLVSDVDKLCELILSEANVAVVSGEAFGDPNCVRISYAIETRQVETGLRRMHEFFESVM